MQPNNTNLDIEAWKDLLLRRELEAINQTATMRAMMARIQELEATVNTGLDDDKTTEPET